MPEPVLVEAHGRWLLADPTAGGLQFSVLNFSSIAAAREHCARHNEAAPGAEIDGLRLSAVRIDTLLAVHGGAITAKDVADKVGGSYAMNLHRVNRMIEEGLLADGRTASFARRRLSLTDRGCILVQRIMEA